MPFDHPDVWKLTVRQKRDLYGKHRIAVGSKGPEGTENEGWMSKLNCLIYFELF